MTCSWAGCRRPSTVTVDAWEFCRSHHREHVDLTRIPGGVLGYAVALTKDVDPRPNRMLTRQQLLDAVLAESVRPVPSVPGRPALDPMRNLRGRRQDRSAA